jgi:4-diphosphocytidyl-2-C-methyl-D-erythritol kinase
MLCFPGCKINLGLYITGRRPDGYHNIETVFYPVPWEDVLEIVPAERTAIYLYGKAVAGDSKDNLVYKAYELLQKQYPDRVPAMEIHLLKNIPMGAGLGGGSADGAFMLKLLNDYCDLGLNNEALAALALQLGSDCPFFIYNTPQFAGGRGEDMEPVGIDLSAYSIQLVCPGIHVSTANAFQLITPQAANFDLRTLGQLPVSEWRQNISNDFEAPVFQQHPEIAAIKRQLYEQGAVYASMSGSGSAVYGIFNKGQRAQLDIKAETFYI